MYSPVVIQITETQYQELKFILEQEQGKEFTIEDAREIADNLVELYILLSYLDSKKKLPVKEGEE